MPAHLGGTKMNFKSLLVGLFAIATLSACSGNDSPTARATASEEAAVVPADEGSSYHAGVPNITFSKESEKLWVDGAAVDEINSDTFDGYPMLDKNVAALRATSKAVETKENSLELYAGENLFLAMDLRGDAPALLHAPEGFTAERIVYTKAESEQDQGMMTASVTFDLRECKVDEKEQEQDQKEPGKGEEQDDKGQDQDQGKGRVIAGNEGEQDQGQDKEQGKEQEKEPTQVCKTSTVTINLNEIAREQEQDQKKGEEQDDKGQGQDQDQGKGGEQGDKGQDQDQGKGDEGDKGQDQDQGKDEGKQEEPKEDKGQDQDQGKGGQEQGDKDQGQQENK
jgi:hypothetical protein